MNITITQPAPYCVSLVMIFSAITLVATKVEKSASPDGAGRPAISQPAPTDAFVERASDQVSANAATATKEPDATNANHIQDAKMASAQSHGSVIAIRTGVEYSVTKVSNITNFHLFDLFTRGKNNISSSNENMCEFFFFSGSSAAC